MNLTEDQLSSIQVLDIELLKTAAQGNIDLNDLARKELANRGLGYDGKWVVFEKY